MRRTQRGSGRPASLTRRCSRSPPSSRHVVSGIQTTENRHQRRGLESPLMSVVFAIRTSVLPRLRHHRPHMRPRDAGDLLSNREAPSFPSTPCRPGHRSAGGRFRWAGLGDTPSIHFVGLPGPWGYFVTEVTNSQCLEYASEQSESIYPRGIYSMCFFSLLSDPYFSIYRSLSSVSISSAAAYDASPASSVHRRPARLARTSIAACS